MKRWTAAASSDSRMATPLRDDMSCHRPMSKTPSPTSARSSGVSECTDEHRQQQRTQPASSGARADHAPPEVEPDAEGCAAGRGRRRRRQGCGGSAAARHFREPAVQLALGIVLAVFVSAMLDPRPSRSGAAAGRAHSDDGCDHLSYARARPHTIGSSLFVLAGLVRVLITEFSFFIDPGQTVTAQCPSSRWLFQGG